MRIGILKMKSQSLLQLGLCLVLLVFGSSTVGQGAQRSEGGDVLSVVCVDSDIHWNITKPAQKEWLPNIPKPAQKDWVPWVDIGIINTCLYCDATDMSLGLTTENNGYQDYELSQTVPAGNAVIFQYQTQGSVVDSVQVLSVKFFNCSSPPERL